jgi:hypothetical protein
VNQLFFFGNEVSEGKKLNAFSLNNPIKKLTIESQPTKI